MRSVLAVVFLFSIINTSFAQNESNDRVRRYLSVSGGSGNISLTNNTLSPLVYRGSGFIWNIQISNHSDKRKHDAIFNTGDAKLDSRLDNASNNSIDNLATFFSYRYQKRIKSGLVKWYGGAGITYFDSERALTLLNRRQSSRNEFLGFEIVTSLNSAFKSRHLLELTLSYALATQVYGLTNIPNGLVSSEDKLLDGISLINISVSANYKYRLSKRLLLDLTYRFHYYSNDDLEIFDYGTSQYLLGMSYQFSK